MHRILGLNGHVAVYAAKSGGIEDFDKLALSLAELPTVIAVTPQIEGQAMVTANAVIHGERERLIGYSPQEHPLVLQLGGNEPDKMAEAARIAEDFGYDEVFSRHIEAWGHEGDCLLAISTSGNSKNVILATEIAKQKNLKVIGLLGKGGGKLKSLVDYPIIVDSNTTDRIQEIHIKTIHLMIEGIEREIFPENYQD